MPWTAADADKFCKGLVPAQKAKWATIANAALSACQARSGTDCEGYAVRVASARVKGAVESCDREWMRSHLGAALREYRSHTRAKPGAKGEYPLLTSALHLFGLTEGEVMEATDTTVAVLQERSDFCESYDVLELDEASGVLRNVKALGVKSLNGREYSAAALDQARDRIEDCPVFRNHVREGESRKSEDHMGVLRHARRTADGVRADWYYTESALPAIRSAVRHKMPGVGLSINGKGKLRGQGDGRPALVEEISDITSTDFVAFPATVRSLAESVEQPGDGLVAAVETDGAENEKESPVDEKVVEQLQALQAQVASLTEQVKAEGDARKKAEADAARVRMVAEAVEEAGRPVSAALRKLLEKCDTKAEMVAVLAECKPVAAASQPMADKPKDPLAEAKADPKVQAKAAVDAIFEAAGKDIVPGRRILEKVGR